MAAARASTVIQRSSDVVIAKYCYDIAKQISRILSASPLDYKAGCEDDRVGVGQSGGET